MFCVITTVKYLYSFHTLVHITKCSHCECHFQLYDNLPDIGEEKVVSMVMSAFSLNLTCVAYNNPLLSHLQINLIYTSVSPEHLPLIILCSMICCINSKIVNITTLILVAEHIIVTP